MTLYSRTTIESWLDEFTHSRSGAERLRIAPMYSLDDTDTALVIAPLENASTTVFIHPPLATGDRWRVVFEPQPDEIALTSEELFALTAELNIAGSLCAFLEMKAGAAEPAPARN